VLSAIPVVRPSFFAELKAIAAQLASQDLPRGVSNVVLDSANRLPRLFLSSEAHSPSDVSFVAREFFEQVIERLVYAVSRDHARLFLTHQNSQALPFWWDYYLAKEGRIHLALVPGNRTTREIKV